LLEVVGGLYRGVAELVFALLVVVYGDVRVLERMAREDAGDALVGFDYSFGPEMF
jgi:hypothetical protein